MSLLYAIILGIVQGLTEFLPVSSSGHIVLLNQIFQVQEDIVFLSIILHIATLFAVVVCYYKEIISLIKKPFSPKAVKLYISVIPTVVIFLAFKAFIESSFGGKYLPFCFMLTAIILLAANIFFKEKREGQIAYRSAILMGVAQGLAIVPGISRSGATICAGLFAGEQREEVMNFSFLMSIPIIIASLAYEIIFSDGSISTFPLIPTITAFIFAFVVGVFAIRFMLKIVKQAKYYYFSIYLAILSVISFFLV